MVLKCYKRTEIDKPLGSDVVERRANDVALLPSTFRVVNSWRWMS